MKETKDDIKRWREIPCSWVERINIVKMTILTNSTYRYNTILSKLSMAIFTELEQKISKFMWKQKKTLNSQSSLQKGMELEESTFLTSDYSTKLQSSRQSGTGIKTEI